VMLLGGPGGALLPGLEAGALGCFGTAVQEQEFSRADVQQVSGEAQSHRTDSSMSDISQVPGGQQ
jgi:hypothetical protein